MFENADSFNQDLSKWNVTSLINAAGMFENIGLFPEYYDALLIGWDAQNLQPNVTFDAGYSMYCKGESARQHMSAPVPNGDGWIISDGGKDCSLDIFLFLPLIFTSAP